jgi:hypothetical protein
MKWQSVWGGTSLSKKSEELGHSKVFLAKFSRNLSDFYIELNKNY